MRTAEELLKELVERDPVSFSYEDFPDRNVWKCDFCGLSGTVHKQNCWWVRARRYLVRKRISHRHWSYSIREDL